MLKTQIEELDSSFHEAILYILKNNGENLTENSSGFFFDLQKISEKSFEELSVMINNIQNNTIKPGTTISAVNKSDVVNGKNTSLDNKSENITVSQKFLSEYNADIQKSDKSNSILKFLNAKKKYLRNIESLASKNDYDLKKECYILN